MSDPVSECLHTWLTGVAGMVVSCAGIVCNVIAVVVLANFRSKSSAPFLLICLSVFDSVYLLSHLIVYTLTDLAKKEVIDPAYSSDITKDIYSKLYPVPFMTHTASAYLVATITLERYIVVCWPFKARVICSMKSARLTVVCVLVFSVLFHIPTCLAFSSGWQWYNDTQQEEFYFRRNEFGSSYFYTEVFYKWLQMTFNFAIPFVILVVVNALTIRALMCRKPVVAVGSTTRNNSEHRLTLMIGGMTLIFFLCELASAVGHALVSGYNKYAELPVFVSRFAAVSDFLMMLNCAVNFAIYCVTGKKFRDTFKRIFTSSKCSKKHNCCCGCGTTNEDHKFGRINFSTESNSTMYTSYTTRYHRTPSPSLPHYSSLQQKSETNKKEPLVNGNATPS